MKRMKKVLALMLAVMMCVTMLGLVAFAADYDQPLTVTGLTDGDTVAFYQILKWAPEDENNVGGWVAMPDYASVLTKATLQEILVGTEDDPATADVDESAPPAGISSDLAGKLARLASGTGTPGVMSEDGKTATLNNTEAGMWMGLVTPTDANTIYNPVFVSADYNKEAGDSIAMSALYSGDAVAKSSTVSLTKTASTQEDTWDDNKSDTTAVGDTVSFTVNTTIPGYGNVYEHPHFVLTDTLTALALNADSVTVVGLVKGTDYTVETAASGYTITFAEAYLESLKAAQPITVTYDAIVTTEAAMSMNPEKNEVQIEYSHDPTDESDYDIKKDTTQHYTFSIDSDVVGGREGQEGKKASEIVKVGVKADGTPITETRTTSEITSTNYVEGPLADAVFGLYTDAACTTPYVPKKTDGTAGDPMINIKSLADGRMHIDGLDAGTYYLKEISAPAGFIKDEQAHKIEIAAFMKEVTVTETIGEKEVTYKTDVLDYYTVKVDGQNTATHHFTNNGTSTDIVWTETDTVELPFPIVNTQGTELPTTGGMGTTIFYIIGAILVIGGGILLISKRRMHAE